MSVWSIVQLFIITRGYVLFSRDPSMTNRRVKFEEEISILLEESHCSSVMVCYCSFVEAVSGLGCGGNTVMSSG